jgi:hypothetical protein
LSNNIDVKDAAGVTKALQATDNSSVWLPAHQICNAAGTTSLGVFAEDAAHTSAHTGLMGLGVRQDTPGNLSGTDGDYEPFQISAGRLWASAIITAIVPGTGATNLGKVEDAAHTTGDVGVMSLAVRNDVHTNALAGTDGDYTPIAVDSSGKIGIRGTFAEDAAHTSGDLGHQVLTVRQDTAAALAGTDADYQPLITDASGRLHVNVGAMSPGSAAASLGKAEDAAHTSGDVGVMSLGVRNDVHTNALSGTDADYTPIGVDSSGKIGIRGTFAEDAAHTTADLGIFILAVANSTHTTTFGSDGDYTPIAVDTTGKVGIRGTFAEDAAHTGGDLGIFVLARRIDTVASSAGTSGDYAAFNQDANGRMWGRALDDGPGWTSVFGVAGAAFVSADQSGSAVAVTDAPTGGQKLVITDITVSVGATAQTVSFTEETSGTLILRVYLPVNGTYTHHFRSKLKLATADKKLFIQTSASGNVSANVGYYSEA